MVRGNFTVVGIGIGLGNYGEYPNTYTAPKKSLSMHKNRACHGWLTYVGICIGFGPNIWTVNKKPE